MQVVYLHGFASSTGSSKAAFFKARLTEKAITLHTPDFNEPDFSSLTITRMLDSVRATIAGLTDDRVALIGSSLGGFVALQAAAQHQGRVDRLVLLAPALEFSGNRLRDLGDRGIEEWRSTGELNVFHYGYGRVMPVAFGLYSDALNYDPYNLSVEIPIQIFQGRRDTAVSPEAVERWAAAHPNAELHMLDDDHQLAGSLDSIWSAMEPFLFRLKADQ